MVMEREWIGRQAVALWGPAPGEYGARGRGTVIAVQSEPTVIIQLPNGEHLHWAMSLCRVEATWEEVERLREQVVCGADA